MENNNWGMQCNGQHDSFARNQRSSNLTSSTLICKYCGKECKSIYSLRSHETLCKMNPNRKESNFVKFNLSEKKYKNQFDKAKKLGLPKPEFSEDSLKRISDATKKRNKQLYKNKHKNIKDFYKTQCTFKFALCDYPQEFDISLIKQFGWYSASNRGNNLNGVSRDHMFSCNEGLKQLIDPYLISHPANCKLMLHSLNASKRNKCSITFKQLKERVNAWNKKYGTYTNIVDYSYFEPYNIMFQK